MLESSNAIDRIPSTIAAGEREGEEDVDAAVAVVVLGEVLDGLHGSSEVFCDLNMILR